MGDPACRMASICLGCGRVVEDIDNERNCPHCGHELEGTELQRIELLDVSEE